MPETRYHCGFITLAGRPNVGKSTLVNALVGSKISIVSTKPQTTRFKIVGIHSTVDSQFIYLDVPGLQRGAKSGLNQRMNQATGQALEEADVILMIVEANHWTEDDDHVLYKCFQMARPLVLAVNKIDKLNPRSKLLPFLDTIQSKAVFNAIVPVSAHTHENIQQLEVAIKALLPISPKLFPEDQLMVHDRRIHAAECIREKVMQYLDKEVPYSTAVRVQEYRVEKGMLYIEAVIWVEREGQKAIVIGHKGGMLTRIGKAARLELERENNCRVFLHLYVKTRDHWTNDEAALNILATAGES